MSRSSYKGYFKPTNRNKYQGNPDQIVYRSRWELVLMTRFDLNPDVLAWSSEPMAIPYTDLASRNADGSRGRFRRYFPDFVIRVRNKQGEIETLMIEVKPKKETKPPERAKIKKQQRYITEMMTWQKNMCKWEAAKRFCDRQGWKFVVMTEDDIGLKF